MRYKEAILADIEHAKTLSQTSMAGMEKRAIKPENLYENLQAILAQLEKIESQINRE